MFIALTILHVLVSILLVLVVLIQTGRGAELGAAFGGLGQATYGRAPTTPLAKLTAALAVVFMLSSLTLAFLVNERPSSSALTPSSMAPQSGPASDTPAAPPAAPAPAPAQPATGAAAPASAPTPAPTLPQAPAPVQTPAPPRQ